MSKFCTKCGKQIHEDDFLCPYCGAIWGEPIYRTPISYGAENAVATDAEASSTETTDEPAVTLQKKQSRWIPIIAALCLLLAFGFFMISSDLALWAGEGSTAPSTTTEPATTAPEYIFTMPSNPDLPYTVYTVKFVDAYGTPIPGVRIENLFSVIMDGFLSSSSVLKPIETLTSDDNGIATLILYKSYDIDAHVHILSVPQGYDQNMVGQIRYYAEGQTEMLIVLKFSDEPPMEIDPTEPSYGDEAYITYTVQFVDPVGNPVSGVKIYNPMTWLSSAYLYSNSDGMIAFSLPYTIHEVVIAGVPDGYSDELVLVPQSLEGGTYLMIVLKYALDLPSADFDV